MAENFKPQPYYLKYDIDNSMYSIDVNLSSRTVIFTDIDEDQILSIDINRLKLIIEHIEAKCNEYEHG